MAERSFKLLRPYTFDECTFDFTDQRCAREISDFGCGEFMDECTEVIGLSEQYKRTVEYNRTFEEHFSASDSAVFKEALRSTFVESLSFAETTPPVPTSTFTESIGVSGEEKPPASTRVERKISITGRLSNKFSHEHASGLSVHEGHSRKFTARRTFQEKISLHGTIGKRIEQTYIERIGVGDVLIPALRSDFTERLSLYDSLLRASNASVSDVTIGKPMTFEDFKKRIIRPLGYEGFRPFHVGEYEYEKALVRTSMTAGSFGAIPEIYDVAMNVDIDDTVDRGTMYLKAEQTVVLFNKHYYTKPEVTVTIQRGNTADGVLSPEIIEIGTESFVCVLRKRDGTAASGAISWTAIGY